MRSCLYRKLLRGQCGCPKQVYRNAKSRITKSRHVTLLRLASHESMRRKSRVRDYHIELGRFTKKVECPHIGSLLGLGVKLRVGDRQGRIKCHSALCVNVACEQEIKPDRRVGVRPWLRVLGLRCCGHHDGRGDGKRRATQETVSDTHSGHFASSKRYASTANLIAGQTCISIRSGTAKVGGYCGRKRLNEYGRKRTSAAPASMSVQGLKQKSAPRPRGSRMNRTGRRGITCGWRGWVGLTCIKWRYRPSHKRH